MPRKLHVVRQETYICYGHFAQHFNDLHVFDRYATHARDRAIGNHEVVLCPAILGVVQNKHQKLFHNF